MADSNLTPEQFNILFGDSDAAQAAGRVPALPSASPHASLTDEEYMILFGDTMTLSLDGNETVSLDDDDTDSADQTTDQLIWRAPKHSAPQHLAPQHSADTEVEDSSGYVGTRFATSLDEAEDLIIDLHAEPVDADSDSADGRRPHAPVPEAAGLVDRMVSKVKQRLSDELGSADY